MKHFLYILLYSASTSVAFAQTFNIKTYGANGDGKTLNTIAVQKAVDECFNAGGGEVLVPTGVFIIGTVYLKSNVHLYLESGAILRGSSDVKDYVPFNEVHLGMLYAENAENITISGFGNIDGNGDGYFDLNSAKKIDKEGTKYTRQKDSYRKVEDGGIGDGPIVPRDRPYQMFIFSNCKRVTVKDIYVSKAPFWTMHFADCDGVKVDGIRLWTNMLAPNADGIDITSCSNVTISNCDIRAGDDAIAIVGYDLHFEIPGFKRMRHISENINVTNCNLQSYSSGIRIGYLDQNSVRNINIANCNITNSTRGIGIFVRDQGSLENINISHMVIETKLRTGDWWGNGEPIHISAVRGNDSVKLGKISNVKFDNIICKSENGILLYGSKESVMENISFNNISFELIDSKLNDVAGGNIDLRGSSLQKALFQHDIPAFFAQYVNGLTIENFKLKWTATRMPYFTHGIEVTNFENLKIRNFEGTASPINTKAFSIFLENGKKATIDTKVGLKQVNIIK
ncbi:MAG: glycosyl hydrolase family 28 protein [Ferruginibacter sp.]